MTRKYSDGQHLNRVVFSGRREPVVIVSGHRDRADRWRYVVVNENDVMLAVYEQYLEPAPAKFNEGDRVFSRSLGAKFTVTSRFTDDSGQWYYRLPYTTYSVHTRPENDLEAAADVIEPAPVPLGWGTLAKPKERRDMQELRDALHVWLSDYDGFNLDQLSRRVSKGMTMRVIEHRQLLQQLETEYDL